MNNHYQTLKVSRDAPPEVIRMAYKVLCQKYHPDKYPGNRESAERITKELNAAYAVLSNPEKKNAYDEFLDGIETKDGQEQDHESAQQDHKAKEEPKQESRHNADESEAKPHYKPYDSQRQPPQDPPKPRQQTENYHPWRRFFARSIDYSCGGLLVGLIMGRLEVMGLLHHKVMIGLLHPVIRSFFIMPITFFLWMLLEPHIIGILGNTPGKKLFGLQIVSDSQQSNHVKRAFSVWVIGMGFGLPIVGLITNTLAYFRLKRTGQTMWDEGWGFTVEAEPLSFLRGLTATVISLLLLQRFQYQIVT